MSKKTKVRVSRITIARLYSSGQYEHVRYELTADVPPGVSATKVAKGIMAVLHAASPKCPVNEYQMEEIQRRINWPADQQKTYWGDKWEKRLEEVKTELAADQKILEEWQSNRKRALEAMDDLTGVDTQDVPF